MSKSKHTSGPWKVRAATFCEDGTPSYEVVMPGTPNMNAVDARLIAASPELLESLEGLLSDPHGCAFCDYGKLRPTASEHEPDCKWVTARAAIAKATDIPTW